MARQVSELHFEDDWSAGRSYNDDLVYYDASVDGQGGEIRDKPVFTIEEAAYYLNRGIGVQEYEGNFYNSGANWDGAQGTADNEWYGLAASKTNGGVGPLTTLNFGFYETQASLSAAYTAFGFAAGFSTFDAEQREATRQAIESWDDLIAISFVETSSAEGDINLMNTTTGPIQAAALLPYNYGAFYADMVGDVFVNPNQSSNHQFDEGQYGLTTLIHEIGHALGLEHPGDYNFSANFSATYENGAEYYQDSAQYSIMSYWDGEETGSNRVNWEFLTYNYASTPSVHDVAAIQRIYGADMTTRTGDNTYGFNTTEEAEGSFDFANNLAPIVTIWDAGGNDTLDLSGFDTPSIIDLNPGAFTSAGGFLSADIPTLEEINARRAEEGLSARSQGTYDLYLDLFGDSFTNGLMSDNIAIAYGATIENAVGGAGDDAITGNGVANGLSGGAGDDLIVGGAGDDIIAGGSGRDDLTGGAGNDIFVFGDADARDRIRDFDSGSDSIDLTAFGIDSSDVKLAGRNLFADTDGDGGDDLHILVQGEKIQMSDVLFASSSSSSAEASGAGGSLSQYEYVVV